MGSNYLFGRLRYHHVQENGCDGRRRRRGRALRRALRRSLIARERRREDQVKEEEQASQEGYSCNSGCHALAIPADRGGKERGRGVEGWRQ